MSDDDYDRLLLVEAALRRSQERIEELLQISSGSRAPTLALWQQEILAALEAVRTVRANFIEAR